jgi:FMN-dependent NADH-azoreductase
LEAKKFYLLEFIEEYQAKHPEAKFTYWDLAENPV